MQASRDNKPLRSKPLRSILTFIQYIYKFSTSTNSMNKLVIADFILQTDFASIWEASLLPFLPLLPLPFRGGASRPQHPE